MSHYSSPNLEVIYAQFLNKNNMSEAPLKTRRERRIAARQAQILEAAADVFSQKGYARATTREIAEAADVSEGTLYNYFSNKRALLMGVAKAYGDEVAGTIASIEAEDIEEMMTQLITSRFRDGRERRLFLLFLNEARLNEDVRQYYVEEALYRIIRETEKRLQTLIEIGMMRPVNPAVAARTVSAAIMGFAALFELGGEIRGGLLVAGGDTFSPDFLGAQVADIILNGLQAPSQPDRPPAVQGF